MTPLDFNLWSHIKSLIYEASVESEMDLVARIAVAAGQIAENPRIFEHARQSILKRYQTCIDVGMDILSGYSKLTSRINFVIQKINLSFF